MYAQIIDDVTGVTIASASTVDKELSNDIKNGASLNQLVKLANLIAKRAKEKGVVQHGI